MTLKKKRTIKYGETINLSDELLQILDTNTLFNSKNNIKVSS